MSDQSAFLTKTWHRCSVMSSYGNVNISVFSQGTDSWGAAGVMVVVPVQSLPALFETTPVAPAMLTDLVVIS